MKELFELSFAPENLFATILLMFVGLYWLVFLVGLLDISFLDFDLDKDIDVELDLDLDVEADVDVDVDGDGDSNLGQESSGHASQSLGIRILTFLNLGEVPLMAFMSFFALFFWAGCILGNYYLGPGALIAIGVIFGSILASALITKFATQPFRALFRSLNDFEKSLDLTGQLCTVELGTEGERLGQANISLEDKYLLINIRSDDGSRLNRGEECVILSKGEEGNYYFVQRFELE